MPSEIVIQVDGIPRPGGSKRAFVNRFTGRAALADASGEKGKDWKASVAACAREVYSGPLLDEAVDVTMVFTMMRPKAHYNKRGLKPNAPTHHESRPDVLKLARSTEDALTGIVWRDDAKNVRLSLEKPYGERPGATITIRPLVPQPIEAEAGT